MCVRPLGHLKRVVENLEDATEQRQRAGDVDVQVAERGGRAGQAPGENGHHAHDSAEGGLAAHHQVAAEEQQQRWSERHERLIHHAEPPTNHRLSNLEAEQFMVDSAEPRSLGTSFGEGFDQQDARDTEHFLHVGAHLGQLLLGLLARAVRRLADVAAGDEHQRHEHKGGQGEAPVERHHQRQRDAEGDDAAHQPEDCLRHHVLDAADVVVQTRQQIARATVGEKTRPTAREGDRTAAPAGRT